MRKFSKAVSLILALALIFGSMTLAFAADEKSAAAGGVSGDVYKRQESHLPHQ